MPGTNILIVDDRPENLVVLDAVLAQPGLNLFTASSGAEALKLMLSHEFALLLLDVQMPVLDGFELANLIRSRPRTRSTPIIFITAINKEDRYVMRGYECGAVDYIYKPFDPDILRYKVRVFIELDEQRRELQRQSDLIRQTELRDADRRYQERERANRILAQKQTEIRQRAFLRDVFASVTGGKLRLCNRAAELPKRERALCRPIALTLSNASRMRFLALEASARCDFSDHRSRDLETAVGEAVTNAIVHGNGGHGRVCTVGADTVRVWIEDQGQGINLQQLPRATLERGYSTTGTLGHGFWLMLQLVDRLWLLSEPTGTTIVLEQNRFTPEPVW